MRSSNGLVKDWTQNRNEKVIASENKTTAHKAKAETKLCKETAKQILLDKKQPELGCRLFLETMFEIIKLSLLNCHPSLLSGRTQAGMWMLICQELGRTAADGKCLSHWLWVELNQWPGGENTFCSQPLPSWKWILQLLGQCHPSNRQYLNKYSTVDPSKPFQVTRMLLS